MSAAFVRAVSITYARRFGVLGLNLDDGVMPVAVCDQDGLLILDKITTLLGVPTEPLWVEPEELSEAINLAYGRHSGGADRVIAQLDGPSAESLVEQWTAHGDLLEGDGGSPVTRLVNAILLEAVRRRASDVHLQPLEDSLQVRLRIDGVLYDFVQPPRSMLDELVSRIKVMTNLNIAEKRLPQDGRTTVRMGDTTIDLRVSTLPTCHGERVVLRLLDKSARLYTLPELGMAKKDLQDFRGIIRQSHGLILVTGPTGSGKSTTLYAALQELNRTELNVLTLEDPIEYRLDGVSQTQVSQHKGMTFVTGLRTVLRQDPDVIMVGEIRDEATARMAIQSALTGHLVFSTLHTNDAAGAIARLLDLGVEAYLVAGSLLAVVAQRLVRRVCDACKRTTHLTQRQLALLHLETQRLGESVFESLGCEVCQQTGYHDRMGLFELLRVDDGLRDLIAQRPTTLALKARARVQGMTTLREDAVRKLLAGTTTVAEVIRVTYDDAETTSVGANAEKRR